MPSYDAFISYSHLKDKPLAGRLQSVIQTLGKPWYRRRSLRVFRDDTSLSATPHLWPSIEAALEQSRFLILLASREAADSKWVAKEVEYWLENKEPDTLLIATTDGELSWQASASDFDWSSPATPLPAVLKGHFASEPKWVDLCAYRGGASTCDAKFEELGADFAAHIKGVPKEDLLSEELRQQRKALTLAWSMVGLLVVLGGAAFWQWRAATVAAQEAREQRDLAEKRLELATKTANGLVFDLAGKFNDASGMPKSLINDIQGRARKLQEQLTAGGADNNELRHSQAAALGLTVDTRLAIGDTEGAIAAARQAVAIMEALSASDPGNSVWRRVLSASYNKIGDVQKTQLDFASALKSYRDSLAIREALSASDPGKAVWRQSLTVSYINIGDVQIAQGDFVAALKSYRDSLAIREELSASDPGNTDLRRRLSVSYERVGDVLKAQRDLAPALKSYRDSVAIREALSASDPGNTEWRRDLSIGYEKVGDVQFIQGDLATALRSFRDSNAIREALAASDPGNAGWRRDLTGSYNKVGDVQMAQGDLAAALKSYRDSLAISEELVVSDPANAGWRRGLAASYEHIGDIAARLGDAKVASAAFERALSAYEALSRTHPDNVQSRLFLVVPHWRLAGLDVAHARTHLEAAVAILEPLAAGGRLDAERRGWIGQIKAQLAALDNPALASPRDESPK